MLAPNKNPAALADKNTELAVRLKISEEQNRLLREENQRLKQIAQSLQQIKGELEKTIERKVLLEEEVRWLKAHCRSRWRALPYSRTSSRPSLTSGCRFTE
jgi:hypothetical protein